MQLRRFLELKPYLGFVRRLDITPIQTAKGYRDDAQLRRRVDGLADFELLAQSSRPTLSAHHARYITSVSSDAMAASLELSTFLDVFCEVTHPSRVVDLGSGFSSFVLRSCAQRVGHGMEVHSVDDHEGWLQKTAEYLESHDLKADNLWVWQDFIEAVQPQSFDMVLHDMGSMAFRAQSLHQVLGLARPGGYVVLDDVHKSDYRRHVQTVLEELGLEYLSLKKITCDAKARYAYLVFVS